MNEAILVLDQGTTSSRAIVFAQNGAILALAQQEFPQIYPAPGWVEHDPEAIWQSSLAVLRRALAAASAKGAQILGLGIANQRETSLIWRRDNGQTFGNALVWQDRRTAERCAYLRQNGAENTVSARTGLLLDPYFSATKIGWILDAHDGARAAAQAGQLAFGTVDCFLLWRLTGGKIHATDAANAARTALFDIHAQDWDDDLCALFGAPRALLPAVKDNASRFGDTHPDIFGRALPILAMVGDQQGALIGQGALAPGDVKSTYGTGCFVVLNTGEQALSSRNRLLTTIAYRLDGRVTYALEGSIFIAGAAVQWLRDGLGIIASAAETEALARSADPDHGVILVPAFTGLGAPHWAAKARGAIFGLTRASGKRELARAALEAAAFQTADLLAAMAEDGAAPKHLNVDGGMVGNDWFCGFLADCLGLPVHRPQIMETTALGAAMLAGVSGGLFGSLEEAAQMARPERAFAPMMEDAERQKRLRQWRRAVRLTLAAADEDHA